MIEYVSVEEEAQITKNTIIAAVSGCLGKEINVATSICVPFVILSFIVILRAGLEVFCKRV